MKTRTFIRVATLALVWTATSLAIAQDDDCDDRWRTNGPPLVRIVTPQDGAALLLGHDIQICAVSQNFTDRVARVEFFAGTNSLGVVSNTPLACGGFLLGELGDELACFTWTNAAAGPYTLTAAGC